MEVKIEARQTTVSTLNLSMFVNYKVMSFRYVTVTSVLFPKRVTAINETLFAKIKQTNTLSHEFVSYLFSDIFVEFCRVGVNR